jgi:hypothetical protein
MGVGSPVENRVIVYKDPVAAISANNFSKLPVPTTVLRVTNPEELSISADSSIILARGGDQFSSHEFEADRSYSFTSKLPLDLSQKLHWIDGQHFLVSSDGKLQSIDFEGSNQQSLVNSQLVAGGYFDKDFDLLYSFVAPDTINTKHRIIFTHMRIESDR